ncbi:MAG: DUF1801 domain-containing protein [Acidobacteriota bacterium]
MPKHTPITRETEASVEDFLNSVENEERRSDAFRVLEMFKRVTGLKSKMWGTAIVGFGNHPITYADGGRLDWMMTGFSPRKQTMTLYVISDSPNQPALLEKLGRHSTSRSCLYIKRLSDIDETVLEKIIKDAYDHSEKSRASV